MSEKKPAPVAKEVLRSVKDGAIPQTTLHIPMPPGGKPVPSQNPSKPVK